MSELEISDDTYPNSRPCRNEGCGRPAENGEAYCFPCELERSLFERDSRPAPAAAPIEAE